MKAKTGIAILMAVITLQTGASASELAAYGQTEADNPYFAEAESKITLNANGGQIGSGYLGTETEIELTTQKGKIKLPLPYRSSDYEFEGWYTEDGEKVSSDTIYYSDANLNAKWNITGTRTITFSSDSGSDILPITEKYGETVNVENQVPIKQGYKFIGWYTDPQTKENKVTDITLTDDITLYAKWQQKARYVMPVAQDRIYMTDEEIAENREIMQSMYKPTLTNRQIIRLIQMLQEMLNATK